MILIVKKLGMFLLAGTVAFLLLCLFSAVYYNPSSHLPSPTGATDYIREPNRRYAYMSEGFSFGRVDSGGFNNPGRMAENCSSPDILFMGSSHMEAMYVPPDCSAPYLLNEMLRPEGKTVYSIAISSNPLLRCLKNLNRALEYYHPQEYVVIETMYVTFTIKEMENLLTGRMSRNASYSKDDWRYWIQQPPYVKLIYSQYSNVLNNVDNETQNEDSYVQAARDDWRYKELIGEVMIMLKSISSEHNVEPVLLFHPRLAIQADGSVDTAFNRDDFALLKQACSEYGVIFLDLTDAFMNGYTEGNILPHGFANTEIGAGHINRNGHRIAAESLYDMIKQREAV